MLTSCFVSCTSRNFQLNRSNGLYFILFSRFVHVSPTYNISITQINVGGNVSNLEFDAIFDSGTSFTYLNDPAYSLISDKVSTL